MNNSKPKYLFLDIDGVLNSFNDYKLQGRSFLENINNISFVLGDKQIDYNIHFVSHCGRLNVE